MFKKILIAGALLFSAIVTQAADYSNLKTQPLTIVIPFATGGNSDIVGRLLAARITDRTDIKTVVINKPGANGTIATNFLIQSLPNGHTVMFSNSLPVLNAVLGLPGAPELSRFDFIMPTMESPHVIVVSAKSGIRTYRDFVSRLNTNENYSATFASHKIWVNSIVAHEHKTSPELILYKSQAEALTAVLKGEVIFTIAGMADSRALIQSGDLVAIASATEHRIPVIPNVPTLKELGHVNAVFSGYFGIYAPAGLSKATREQLNMLFQDALWDAQTIAVLHNRGLIPMGGNLDKAQQHKKFLIQRHGQEIATEAKAAPR
jgi:tripartite-type tricarboxylate transporter receptor subunit TctC